MKIAAVVPNYNGAAVVARCIEGLLAQVLEPSHSLSVVVVDDGSTDESVALLKAQFGKRVELVCLDRNCGRCTARNIGAFRANADIIVFIDSDCVPADPTFVSTHVSALMETADISFGEVLTPGDGFWDQLQRDGSRWRRERFLAGDFWAFTTQNVAVRSDLFERVGGFDTVIERHGFEERDLFVRLAAAGGRGRHTPNARVRHEDKVGLASVSRKLGEAGELAAAEFSARHPSVYQAMSFSKLDCGQRRYLLAVDAFFWPIVRHLTSHAEAALHFKLLPFQARAFLARGLYGFSFLHGTAVRERRKWPKPAIR